MSMVADWFGDGAVRRHRVNLVVVIALGLTAIGAGILLLPGRAQHMAMTSAQAMRAAEVDGFRSAQFGMTEGAVRAAIVTDFGVKSDAIKVIDNKVERTRVLVVRVPDLFKDAGLTEIGYVLGYKSKALIQVNLLWGTPLSPQITESQISLISANLLRYFSVEGFPANRVQQRVKIGKDATLLFQGADRKGRLVQLVRRSEALPDKTQRLTLRLAYIAETKNPDVFKIAKGAF
jgi:hypothetical protein